MISLFFIEFIRVGGGERFRIDDSQSLDFIYDTASWCFWGRTSIMLFLSYKNHRIPTAYLFPHVIIKIKFTGIKEVFFALVQSIDKCFGFMIGFLMTFNQALVACRR